MSYFVAFSNSTEDEPPDETTLCRFRNWLMHTGLMPILLEEINAKLKSRGLRVERSKDAAIIDATIIETAGGKTPKHLEVLLDKIKAKLVFTPIKAMRVLPIGLC